MNWTLLVTKPARKALAKLPNRDQSRIERALDALAVDPFSGDIKHLQALGWRAHNVMNPALELIGWRD